MNLKEALVGLIKDIKLGLVTDRLEYSKMRYWIFVLLGFFWCGVSLAEGQPAADQVLASILRQPLATTNPAIQSYEAEIEVGTMGMRYSFWYQKTNGTALWVVDTQDGTPVLVATEGTLAVYDTLSSTIFLMTNKYACLEFKSKYSNEPGKSSINMDAGFSSHPTWAKGEIQLPPMVVFSNSSPELKPKGGGVYEVRVSSTSRLHQIGETLTWSFIGVADWPAKDVPYRNMELRGAPFVSVLVKSVNQPMATGYFQFPLQGLLTAGLPVRRIPAGDTNETSQITSLMTANFRIRQALHSGNPQKAKEDIQKYCQSLSSETGEQKLLQISEDALHEYKRLRGDPQAWEKILSEVPEEQWESIRLSQYASLSSEEFAKKRMNLAFRKELADKIVAELAEGAQKMDGQGANPEDTILGIMRGYKDAASRLDNIDLEALRVKDQKIAAQLRQAFQLEVISSK